MIRSGANADVYGGEVLWRALTGKPQDAPVVVSFSRSRSGWVTVPKILFNAHRLVHRLLWGTVETPLERAQRLGLSRQPNGVSSGCFESGLEGLSGLEDGPEYIDASAGESMTADQRVHGTTGEVPIDRFRLGIARPRGGDLLCITNNRRVRM